VEQRKIVREFVNCIAEPPKDEPAVPTFAPVSEVPAQAEPSQPASDNDRLSEIMAKDIADMTNEEYNLYTEEVRRQAIGEKKAAGNALVSQDDSWTQRRA